MKKRLLGFAALSLMLTGFLVAAVPAGAQNVEQKIQALENELQQLKTQQIELKKEATAAAAAMPSITYTPGSGVKIEGADKSYSLGLSHEVDWLMPIESGSSHAGRTQGEIMGRRFRQEWTLCVNNCFYEIQSRLDLDGFNTNSEIQRGAAFVHFENINPWLPTVYFGMDIPSSMSEFRQGSSSTGTQGEYDLLSRNNGFNTGSTGNGIGINWDDKPLFGFGKINRFNFMAGAVGSAGEGNSRFSNTKDYVAYISISPFSQIKNKWIQGFTFESGNWFCNNDDHAQTTTTTTTSVATSSTTGLATATRIDQTTRYGPGAPTSNGCSQLNIRDHGPGGRQTLFNTGLLTGGLARFHMAGIGWTVGPYRLRAVVGFQRYTDEDGDRFTQTRVRVQTPTAGGAPTVTTTTTNLGSAGNKQARVWLIGHDLFLWSPKGWLTGSSTTPGSIQVGTHFERTDVSCGFSPDTSVTLTNSSGVIVTRQALNLPRNATCNRITPSTSTSAPEFKRNRILIREWDIWYYVAPRASIGLNFLWYDASNLPTGFSSTSGINNDVQKNLGATGDCRNKASLVSGAVDGAFVLDRKGCGGNWVDVWLRLRWSF